MQKFVLVWTFTLFVPGREGGGGGEGRVGRLKVPGLNLHFPHVLTFPESIGK